ncbi:MAG: TonB-dependent receptor [Tannerella sp.]|jgi:TonB-linked SusC/RagA family outer membrane protein|nr:TonB-dependent receptor [Tannerella sp.]
MKRKLKLFFALFFVGVGFLAAQTQVRGMVVDETGEPVIGATIQIKGTSQGTATDADGRFTLSAPADGMLVISYIGMQTQEVPVGANVSVVLTASTELLDEVLVVAYGTSRRSAVTGAISTVDVSQIEKRPVSSISSVLEGTGTGIQVNSTYGQPGQDASIRIRGFGSVTGSNTPLYVLDGVPFGGNISDLNANDIENISVLKDATSAALYGNRASNGVILITTKKGKSERVRIRMSTNQGVYTRGLAEYDRVNADDFMEVMWQGYRNQLVSNGRTPEEAGQTASGTLVSDILLYNVYNKPGDQLFDANGKLLSDASIRSGYANDLNWYKPIERKGYRQEYNLSGEGATEKNNFFFSVGYLGEQGYIINSGFDRLTARANINLTPNKWFKTGISVSGSHQNADYTNGDATASFTNPFMYARNIAPIYPVHLHNMENGEYLLDENGDKQYDGGSEYGRPQYPSRHVVWEMELDRDNSIRNTINSIMYADIRFLNDFVFTLKGDMNLRNSERRAYNNATIGDGAGNNGRSSRNIYRYKNYSFQQQLNWNRTFNGLHFVDALVGHENYSYNYSYLYGYKTTEIFPGAIEMQNFTAITSLYDYQQNYRTESYLGRVRYSYDEKYHADASYRRDGSSRFHPDHRWGNFWSMGVNWIASKEDFIKEIDWINALKVRASYGEVGNDESVSYYGYMALYSMAQNANKGAAYKTQNEASNIKWESAASFSAAVEATLFKRLDLSLEYFDKRTNDLLFDVYMPLSAGATSTSAAEATITKNLGSVSNRGVEFTIDYSILQSKEWEWKIGGNATWLKNKILTLPEQNRENGIISSTKKYMEGHGIYDYWLYQFAGVDRLTGNALYLPNLEDYFINRGGDNKLGDGSDEIPGEHLVKIGEEYYTKNPTFGKRDWSGSVIPKVYGALNTSLSYKNFTLTGLATYAIGGKTIDYSYQSLMSASGSPHALHKDILDSWSSPEGITENSPNRIDPNGIPVVDFARSNFNNATSSRFLTDGSYFVVKNISLSYLFPRQLIRKIDFESIRLNASVENLATFTKRKGMNPQQSFAGTSDNVMVTPRVFTVGVSFQF